MAYATTDDVAVRWGRELSPEEVALIGVRLEDVERMIRRRIPDLDAKVQSGVVFVEDVVQVESDAVLRLARNPEGYVSETDGNYTYTLHKDLATGKLSITDDEWEILGAPRSSAFAIVPRPMMEVGMGTEFFGTRRRTVEAAWQRNRVIDWARQIW